MFSFNLRFNNVNMRDPKIFGEVTMARDELHVLGIVQRLRGRGLDKKQAMK